MNYFDNADNVCFQWHCGSVRTFQYWHRLRDRLTQKKKKKTDIGSCIWVLIKLA